MNPLEYIRDYLRLRKFRKRVFIIYHELEGFENVPAKEVYFANITIKEDLDPEYYASSIEEYLAGMDAIFLLAWNHDDIKVAREVACKVKNDGVFPFLIEDISGTEEKPFVVFTLTKIGDIPPGMKRLYSGAFRKRKN